MADKSKSKIAELEANVVKARQALAATEAARAELLVASEPTSDLQTELKRAADVQVKQTALERVIVAQRRELESAQAVLDAERVPFLRGELARVERQAQAKIDEIAKHAWAMLELAAVHREVQDDWGRLAQQLDPSPYAQSRHARLLRTIWELTCKVLAEMGEGHHAAGPNGSEFIPAAVFAARDAEANRQHALRVAAIEKQRERERQAAASNGGVYVRVR